MLMAAVRDGAYEDEGWCRIVGIREWWWRRAIGGRWRWWFVVDLVIAGSS